MEINLLKSILGRAVLLHGVVALSDMALKCCGTDQGAGASGVWSSPVKGMLPVLE